MKTRRRKITSETIYNHETEEREPRFPRCAFHKLKRYEKEITVAENSRSLPTIKKTIPTKFVRVVRGKLTGRTKGAFGKSKWENRKENE